MANTVLAVDEEYVLAGAMGDYLADTATPLT